MYAEQSIAEHRNTAPYPTPLPDHDDESADVITLRSVETADLDEFFSHQLEPSANHMAAFAAKNPSDRGVFNHHWQNILSDPSITVRTIESDGQVVGSVLSYLNDGVPEISYWIDKAHWGRGITTDAVGQFLEEFPARPIRARTVVDNLGSIKVLEKWGFAEVGRAQGFANARGVVVDEVIMELAENSTDSVSAN